ncbi:hypothetical protein JCM13664_04480 [Methylothermus subterraneus]
MRHEKTAWIEDERLAARLGLAASKAKRQDPCPPAEQLSAFIDGRLSLPERRAILAHLNACEPCYQAWLEAALALSELPSQAPPKRAWWQTLQEVWRARPWMLPLTAALAVSFAVLAVVMQKPAPEIEPIPQLAAVVRHHPGLDQALAALPQELESTGFAFSDTPQDLAKQAFAAGFSEARRWFDGAQPAEAVGPAQKWQRPPGRDYYDLGQWAFLTWALAQAENVRAEEWQAFARHGQSLIARFAQHPKEPQATQVLDALREIHAALDALAQRPDPALQVRLVRTLRSTVHQFLS